MTHKGTQELRTKRLVLRRFREEDAQAMFDTWANDERVTKFLTWRPHGKVEVTKALLADWCAQYQREDYYHWVITLEGRAIGAIAVVRLDVKSEQADLGYSMGFDFWGKGIMSEAAGAVIDFLFSEVGMHRVVISHAVKNPASGGVARKCGLQKEGVRREAYRTLEGEWLDLCDWAILDWEWAERNKG